ncbi:uncharacterized conserved protein [Longilinea arvoryzae]|uniref:Uncharacterized conserved protein n=1 Tax=Longilinea arvoryzae TaxID=360412 RepID=A0A0S7BG47_9CHLR|nr:ferritin family protein [Longilinea arvoryzae]GAP14489.1 uncharacterized conserved protein [Longilinea arvoryzae]
MSTPSLLDAVRIVKENERVASDNYAEASRKVDHSRSKVLFEQLSEFEQYHFEKLSALEASLEKSGGFIPYEGKELKLPPIFEIRAAQEPDRKTIMQIISAALDLEEESEKAYSDLANRISDKHGREMFKRLAEEEHKHFQTLTDVYWTLTNLGTWQYSQT